jgi:3-dehydroquinate synthase
MKIQSLLKSYIVKFHQDFTFFNEIIKIPNAFFLIDKNVYENYYKSLFYNLSSTQFVLVNSNEENKSTDTSLKIIEKLVQLSSKRNTIVVSIGGGIVQDISAFVCSILYRGIQWIYIPTTLLAAADSCIGGKSSLNFKNFKNLLGTYNPPEEILVCPLFLLTLSSSDFLSGLGEIFKFELLKSKGNLLALKKDSTKLLDRNVNVLNEYILSSLQFKKTYIEKDEFDKGIRIHLNFGHTFGHAIESASNYSIPHGIAVSMGILVANWISYKRNLIPLQFLNESQELLNSIIPNHLKHNDFEFSLILSAIKNDKKQTNNSINALLFNSRFEIEIYRDLLPKEIEDAFIHLKAFLK